MTVFKFLSSLESLGIDIWLEDDQLRYRAPKGVMTSTIKQELMESKTEILSFLRKARDAKQSTARPILPIERNRDLPLSFSQQRMWFLYELDRENTSYNESLQLRISGVPNVALLEQSINEIIHRHEALRTIFTTVDGLAVQRILPSLTINIPVLDLQGLKEAEIQQRVIDGIRKPFDLEKQPLLRVSLLRLKPELHLLILTIHHIIVDGWSIGIFIKELSDLYQAFSVGSPTPLPKLTIQYGDFAVWQREWLTEELQQQLDYWKQQLADAPPLLELPTDYPRPSVQSFSGAVKKWQLNSNLSAQLKTLSQESGTTLFVTLLVAFVVLLHRYSHQDDICIGSPFANRNRTEIEPLIGCFINTLVLRTQINDRSSFRELIARVHSVVLDAHAHQDVPFEQVVEAIQPERSLGYNPLFQVIFVLENFSLDTLELPDISLTPEIVEQDTAQVDLRLAIWQTQQGLIGSWRYNSDLFDASTIERMASHFVTLLEGIVANPLQKISQLPLLTEVEQQQLLVEWNKTQVDYPSSKCIHQLFEEQVERTPDAVAVVFENQQLTYRQLNSRSNQLAHYLKSLGVGADVLVGLCVERSPDTIIGLLGILKAGGAYLPLDPEYPTERLLVMLKDARVPVLLTQQNIIAGLPQHQAELVCLDTDWRRISQAVESNPVCEIQPENLAYAIYTSGSTGEPKGVLIQHSSVVNLANGLHQAIYSQHQRSRLQVSLNGSLAFDTSVKQIIQLIYGHALDIVPEKVRFDGNAMLSYLWQQKIDVLDCTPSQLGLLISAGLLDSEAAPQYVLVGGEPIDESMWATLAQAHNINFYNVYGPTECTVDTTVCLITANLKPVIGRPITNVKTYILDEYLQPVPVGVPGELHVGGAGLARGYLNAKELTQKKLIPNPFDKTAGSRLYKTGDLARYLSDGNIEYLGRIDNQVKIRGFRIELGEIEAVLGQYPHVQTACVISHEDRPGIKRLVAYIVPQKDVTPTTSELRQFLKTRLPDYMVPSAFVILEALPLTRNGKVDRRALKAPDLREGLEVSFVAPHTPEEEILAQIWSEVLRVEQVGIHDNFFELGGDSILTIQIIVRARQAGLQLIPKQFFTHQTIAELAVVAETNRVAQIEQGLVTGAVTLTPIQQRFFEQNSPEKHHYNQSFLLSVPSNLKPELLEQAWQQLLVHHDALRLRFTQPDDRWQQIHSTGCDRVTVSFVDLSTLPDSEQQTTIAATASSLQASLQLAENLVQVAFFWLGVDKRARLLIIIHHLVVDGVSWRILLEDLQTAYQQLSQGQTISLPAKTTSFKDWAQHLVEYGQSDVLKSELPYWLSVSSASVYSIPVDHTAGANTVSSARTISVFLNEAQTQALLQDVPKAYKTQINDVLLTALALVLSRWTHSESVFFNLEGHGRENIVDGVDLSRTVGWFTTIFPVVLNIPATDKDNIGDVLKSVKEQLRTIPNKGIGYGLLRYLSQKPEIIAQLQTSKQAEISFNYLGQFAQVLNQSSMMQIASESSGQNHSLHHPRPHLLDINAIIIDERLQIDWTYSSNFHQPRTIEKIAQEFLETLQELIDHCLSSENGGYTPTDFPLLQLNQSELDRIFANL
ncbi:non-ribosomal peptide synthetase [Scytonema hofmannii PCC 7110]|uniref:Non-ribosomal peptide synthetase n=1 Tax=Scytonema hofmannii PCC 7110 TaxID=128403 RepID=A0A139XDG7_9CYAN|nr:non-ribosomal peptide synthetase [Scytonema hofmannii]KYC42725.1 non-ribosomal peptide synthetase [Scytonema hofmannii PCC 7110]